MAGFRLISILSILQAGFVSLGYLATELCITVFRGRAGAPLPRIVTLATGYWWAFMAATVVWAIYAFYAQLKAERRLFSTYVPGGTGLLLMLCTFVVYFLATVAAALAPRHLSG